MELPYMLKTGCILLERLSLSWSLRWGTSDVMDGRGNAFPVSCLTSHSLRRDSLAWKMIRFICTNLSCTMDYCFWASRVTSLDPRRKVDLQLWQTREKLMNRKGQTSFWISFSFFTYSGCFKKKIPIVLNIESSLAIFGSVGWKR